MRDLATMGKGKFWVSVLLVSALTACGSSGGDGGGGGDGGVFDFEGWATLRSVPGQTITYNAGFTDGTRPFVVPLAFVGDGVTLEDFTIADTNVAAATLTIPIDNALIPSGITVNAVLVASQAPGNTTITGVVNGTSYTANINVIGYNEADVQLGEERYENPANANADLRRACTSCHGQGDLLNHSTAFLADLTDAEIVQTAVEGTAIQRRNITTGELESYLPNNGVHTWDVTEAERAGIAAYLRSQPPTAQLPGQ